MELQDILAAVREHYLGKYREAIRASREQFPLGVAELMLELNGEVAPAYRYYRIDLTGGTVDHPNFSEVNPETHQPSPVRALSYRGMPLTLSQLVWNGVEFSVSPPVADDAGIQAWALRWLDLEESAVVDADGLGAYVHSITAPEHSTDATSFSVDFGSAPVRSVLELLDVLAAPATCIELHSRSVLAA